MSTHQNYIIVHSDGRSSLVSSQELETLKKNNLLAENDRVVPQQAPIKEIDPGPGRMDDLETEPLDLNFPNAVEQKAKVAFISNEEILTNLNDHEIDGALSEAKSKKFYTLEANTKELDKPNIAIDEHVDSGLSSYSIRFVDGRILGPLTREDIASRIQKGFLKGNESVSKIGEGRFTPIKKSPFFCALFKVYLDSENPPGQSVQRISHLGPGEIFYKFSQKKHTGWLTFTHGLQVKVAAIKSGRLSQVFSNLKNETDREAFEELLNWDAGKYWFSPDPIAAGLSQKISNNIFTLIRAHLLKIENLPGLIHSLGGEFAVALKNEESHWVISEKQLNVLDRNLLDLIKDGLSIDKILQHGDSLKVPKEEIIVALHSLVATNCLHLTMPTNAEKLAEIKDALLPAHFRDLYPLSENASVADKKQIIAEVNREILKDCNFLPKSSIVFIEINTRLQEIGKILLAEASVAPKTTQTVSSNRKVGDSSLQEKTQVRKYSSSLPLIWNGTILGIALSLLWILSIDLGLGKNEFSESHLDLFLLIRPLVLFVAASVGVYVLHKQAPWQLIFPTKKPHSTKIIFSVILLGGILGILFQVSPSHQHIEISTFLLVIMGILFDRLFFSLYLGEEIQRSLSNKWVSGLILTLAYGLYSLTYFEIFEANFTELNIQFWTLLATVALPLAFIQVKLKSNLACLLFLVTYVSLPFFLQLDWRGLF